MVAKLMVGLNGKSLSLVLVMKCCRRHGDVWEHALCRSDMAAACWNKMVRVEQERLNKVDM